MNEVKDLELEVVELGDATDATMGAPIGELPESDLVAPFRLE